MELKLSTDRNLILTRSGAVGQKKESGALLGSQTARSSGIHSLSFTPTSSTATIALNVLVCYTNPSTILMWVNGVGYSQASGYTLVPTLVQIKSVGDDRYEFGYNGQMKVDEVAGVGNHNTALYWEYDTRLGRRWNLDPKPFVGISEYSVLGNNPISNIDPLGDVFRNWNVKSDENKFTFSGAATNTKYFADDSNLNQFNTDITALNSSNDIFKKVYSQLYHSKNVYNVEQHYRYNSAYDSKTKTVGISYHGVGRDADISKTEVFEEFFHAGQDDYYSARGISRSHIEDEVEAKVADIISGHDDASVNGSYNSVKNYFKTGKKDKGFNGELDRLIGDVYMVYAGNGGSDGEKWGKENKPDKVNKANVLGYLESVTDVKSKAKK